MDELELGTNEGNELGFPEGKVTRDGTELGLSECSNDGTIESNLEGLLLGAWLG